MFESKLETNGNERYLIVYYDKVTDDFNEAISRALKRHKLKVGDCPVLVLPILRDTPSIHKDRFRF